MGSREYWYIENTDKYNAAENGAEFITTQEEGEDPDHYMRKWKDAWQQKKPTYG